MMKRNILILLLLFSAIISKGQDSAKYVGWSLKIFEQLKSNDYQGVVEQIDTSGRQSNLDSARLGTAWRNLLKRAGKIKTMEDTIYTHQPTYDIVVLRVQFEEKKMDIKTIFSAKGTLKGIFFLPADTREKYVNPPYYSPETFEEINTEVVNGKFRLKAILTIPKKQGKHPVIILVHGSGPNDKDESVGATKIFRDMAVGIAAQGIAVLRYEKRTRAYAAEMRHKKAIITPEEETIADAVAAIECVKSDPRLDTNRIYFAGHSMGAYLLPKIASRSSRVKGLIMLSPQARPLEDLLVEQTNFVIGLDPAKSADKKHLSDSLQLAAQKVKSLKASDKTDSVKIMGLAPAYWIYLNEYDAFTHASNAKIPMLFIYGGRDYQISSKDEDIWKSKMKTTKQATFKRYSDLNHFYIKGKGKSTPEEYIHSGNVDESVIKDISSWMNADAVK